MRNVAAEMAVVPLTSGGGTSLAPREDKLVNKVKLTVAFYYFGQPLAPRTRNYGVKDHLSPTTSVQVSATASTFEYDLERPSLILISSARKGSHRRSHHTADKHCTVDTGSIVPLVQLRQDQL